MLCVVERLLSYRSIDDLTDLNNIPKPAKRDWEIANVGDKLSNSGNTLELQVPSYSKKAISGWINKSCKVTRLKAFEKGNRGSKSIIGIYSPTSQKPVIVKEQRVDGSCTNKLVLRCTLIGFERNSRIKILSKQIRQYSNKAPIIPVQSLLNPWFITGLVDPHISLRSIYGGPRSARGHL